MAWTRAGQIGAEHNDIAEWLLNGSTQPTVSSTKKQTGTYSVRYTTGTDSVGKSFTAATQIRAGVWLNHNSSSITSSSRRAWIFRWGAADGVRWNNYGDLLELVVNSSVVDSITDVTGNFTNVDQWFHCGIVIKCHASTGWASFYLDGTKILTATSVNTGSSLAAIYFGGKVSIGWLPYAYFDDFYVDTASGGEADVFVPLRQFGWRIAGGNGTNSEWNGSDGNQVNNFEQVDEDPPDDDTTYNYTGASGNQDSYNTTSYSILAGYIQTAEIASVLARKTGSGEQLKVGFDDGVAQSLSGAQDLSADYSVIWSRHTTQPDSTSWNEADGNAMEVLLESAGSY
ncbi:hypothetical protein LCGC14_0386630 [marine sediment metagenome]|uniref:Uncharacterized protein n=1 Tax=marine sediment metagenome TaxID=412755 RepID=A0A0F9T0L3_9ZZZZ